MEPPEGWAADDLGAFFDLARNNHFASFQLRNGSYRRLRDVDALWLTIATNLDNPQAWHPTFFLYRSHSAYRASCILALAGQVPETYMTLRGCLEFALYGLFIHKNPQHWDTWCGRHDSEAAKKLVRNTFTIGAMMETLRAEDATASEIAQTFYDRCIDIGAHPNPQSLFSSLTMTEDDEAIHFSNTYLATGDTIQADLAVRSAAQIGVCAFGICGLIFKQRYELLGLWDRLQPIKAGL